MCVESSSFGVEIDIRDDGWRSAQLYLTSSGFRVVQWAINVTVV